LHALFLSIERITRWPDRLGKSIPAQTVTWLLVSLQVLVAWVFFRAESLDQAWEILKVMFSFQGNTSLGWKFDGTIYILAIISAELFHSFRLGRFVKFKNKAGNCAEIAWYGLLIAIILFFRGNGSEFIYFQF